jgi:molybdate transport system regulatory protein
MLTKMAVKLIRAYRLQRRGRMMQIKYKVWLEKDGEVVVGNGKADLLRIIDELGSIQKAAEKKGMSYRHAWGVVQKIERRAGFKFLETQVGGKDGGGTQLTPEAKKFLDRYTSFRKTLKNTIEGQFKNVFEE